MQLKPSTSYKIRQVAFITVLCVIAGILVELSNSINYDPVTHKHFIYFLFGENALSHLAITSIGPLIGGIVVGSFIVFYQREKLKVKTYKYTDLTTPELSGRFHRFTGLSRESRRRLIVITSWNIDAESRHQKASESRQHVIFGVNEDVPEPIVREPGFFSGPSISFSQSIEMSVLDLFIGNRELDTEPIGDPIVKIQRIHLSDGSNLPMVP